MKPDLVVLGCGYLGEALTRLARARGLRVVGTVRSDVREGRLRPMGFEIIAAPALTADLVGELVGPESHVVVAFPPDGTTDAAIVSRSSEAAAITYISSTGVYGDARGVVNDATAVPAAQTEHGARILRAEDTWRAVGATVLRCPAIYGRDRGIHQRIIRGEHRIAGDGSMFTSRIHVEDLAQLVLAARETRRETFVVGDLAPATQSEIAAWVAHEYGVPIPPHVPIEQVHPTLRSDRQVDGSRALKVLNVTLTYPRYTDGMASLSQ